MEFTEVFSGIAIVLVGIIAIFGLTNAWNAEYGSNLGEDPQFSATKDRVESLLETQFVDRGLDYANSTQQSAGAGSSGDQQDNMITRALKSIGLIDDLIGLVPALIKDGAEALNIPEIYWRIGQSIFWIIFSVTLAYLLILGARTLL